MSWAKHHVQQSDFRFSCSGIFRIAKMVFRFGSENRSKKTRKQIWQDQHLIIICNPNIQIHRKRNRHAMQKVSRAQNLYVDKRLPMSRSEPFFFLSLSPFVLVSLCHFESLDYPLIQCWTPTIHFIHSFITWPRLED